MMSQKNEAAFSRTQPYDTSFKAFLDKVTLELLSFLVEEETAPTDEVEVRLAEYAIMPHHKHRLPVRQLLLCPFETPKLPTPPFQMKLEDEVITVHHYRVVGLWQREAHELLEQRRVRLYPLLPTMKGVTAELLIQGLRDQRAFFAEDESQLCDHLLWFDALLGRTTLLTAEDKRRVRHVMLNEFHGLLDEGYFVQLRREEGRQEGLVEGLQEALLMVTELRFPALLDLAHERVKQARKPENLRLILRGVKAATSEESARLLLDLLAA